MGATATAPGRPLPLDAEHGLVPDADIPPVALTDDQVARSRRWTPARIAGWVLVSLLGALGWFMVAIWRGETVNGIWFVFAAVCSYLIAYRFYSTWVERTLIRPNDLRATPAEVQLDGHDFVPTDRRILFGHHFAAIAGAGPLVGPVLAAQMGYLPGTIWIILGVIFAGAVQDYVVLFVSMRRGGRSLGQMARDELGRFGGVAAILATLSIMLMIIAILALVVVNSLGSSPWGVYSVGLTIPIALFMGFYLRYLRPGKVLEVSLIGAVLLVAAIATGNQVSHSAWGASFFHLERPTIAWILIGYGFVAAVLPVWMLLAPRDYLSTFMKVGVIVMLALAIVVVRPTIRVPAVSEFAHNPHGPAFSGPLFPFLFVTIACGALSGFHAMIGSGTTPKLIEKERQTRLIGYGGMLMESMVAIMALVAAVSIDRGIYFAMNSAAAVTHNSVEGAVAFVNQLGLTGVHLTPDQLVTTAHNVGEPSIVSRTGGAPTLAVGLAQIMHQFIGGTTMMAFWYHFAIMFEALFILTSVDAGTRVARFMLQDALGNLTPRFRDTRWTPGVWITTALVVAGWGSILVMGVTDPLGGINTLYPLFGIANQLLAAVALSVCLLVFANRGRRRSLLIIAVPMLFTATITVYGSLLKIFSSDPAIGYWSTWSRYRDAIHAGRTQLGSAVGRPAMDAVVRNSAIQGCLSILFLVCAVIVMVMASIRTIQVLMGRPRIDTEDPAVVSRIWAPAGLGATPDEKALDAEWADYLAEHPEHPMALGHRGH